MTKFHITGTRRGLGKALLDKYGNCSFEECDVFINCKHDKYSQVDLLYKAAEMGKKIINIGSNSPDETKNTARPYQIEKFALDKANEQLFYQGVDTTILRFGYFDTPRVEHIDANKMSLQYVVSIVEWVLQQPHRVKEITVCP